MKFKIYIYEGIKELKHLKHRHAVESKKPNANDHTLNDAIYVKF